MLLVWTWALTYIRLHVTDREQEREGCSVLRHIPPWPGYSNIPENRSGNRSGNRYVNRYVNRYGNRYVQVSNRLV